MEEVAGATAQAPKDAKRSASKKRATKTSELFVKLRSLHDEHRVDASRLETIQKLGEGGFAYVDLCWFSQPDGSRTQVAVKRVRPDVLKHSTQLKLFTNESEILVKLKHENVVSLLGLGSIDDSTDDSLRDTFFLVEELVDGGSLRLIVLHQMINAPEQLYRIRDGVRWSLQMAQALNYLHNLNPVVVHRDLKPDNVLLTCLDPYEANIKLADFGLSVMIPNKHITTEAKSTETPVRNALKEARWKRGLAPLSQTSASGASAILHMVEAQSMAAAMSTAGEEVAGPTSGAPQSQMGPKIHVPVSKAGLYAPGSKAGLYSGQLNSRTTVTGKPASGLLSKLGAGGGHRTLECPSGVMFDLTSMTGSLLYMAPEVFKGEPYNYKADTFSFGMLMYELLHQRLIMATLIAQQLEDRHTFDNEIMEFTKCVSAGFRPPIEEWVPDYIGELISQCWAQNPTDRPSMQHIISVLERFMNSQELIAIDKSRAPSCCRMC